MEPYRTTGREALSIVYTVISRRSGGLSVGIDLFPDRKVCSFDCPYCEVFPPSAGNPFSLDAMARELRLELAEAAAHGIEVRDICFSGNGEPTLSPDFFLALAEAARIRDELAPRASLVLITNGTTLLDAGIARGLRLAVCGVPWGQRLDIWLKLDAGSEDWFRRIDRPAVPLPALLEAFGRFASSAPLTIQTMVCAIGGEAPSAAESAAWESAVVRLCTVRGARVRLVQIYGKSRPAPEDPLAEPLTPAFLEARAASLREALRNAGASVPVAVFP